MNEVACKRTGMDHELIPPYSCNISGKSQWLYHPTYCTTDRKETSGRPESKKSIRRTALQFQSAIRARNSANIELLLQQVYESVEIRCTKIAAHAVVREHRVRYFQAAPVVTVELGHDVGEPFVVEGEHAGVPS